MAINGSVLSTVHNNIMLVTKNDLKETRFMNASVDLQGPVAGPPEHDNEPQVTQTVGSSAERLL